MADAHAPQGDVAVPSYAVHDGQTPVSTSAEPLANATAAPSTPRVVEGRDVSPSPSVKDAQRPFKPPLSPGERARVRAHRAALLGGFEPPSPPHRTPQERARDRTLNQYAQQSMTSLSKVRDHHLEENIWLLAAVEAVNDCRQRGELDALMSKGGDADVKPSLTAIVKQRLERKVGQLQVELAELGAPASASTSRPAKIREPAHRVLYDVVAKLQTDRANAIKKRDDCRKELAEFLRSAEQNRGLAPIVPDPTVADSKEHLNAPLAPGERGGPNFAYLQIPPDLPRYPEMEKMLRDLRGYVDVVLKFYGETGEFPPPGIYQNPHYPGLNAPHIPEKIYPQRKGRPPAFSLGSSVGAVRALPRALQRLLHGRDLLDAFGRTPSQADERKSAAVKRAGRPPGSRNKRRRAQTDDDQQTDGGSDQGAAPRKRGRPPKLTTSSPLFRSIKLGAGLRDKQGRTVNTVVAQGIDMTEVPMWDSMDPSISTQIPYQLQYQARASSAAAAAAAAAEVDSQAVNQVVDAEATNRMVSDLIEQGFNADDAHAYGSQANVDALMGDEPLNLAQAGRMDSAWELNAFAPPIDMRGERSDWCQNCGRRETSAWRNTVIDGREYRTCNACGLHYQKNGVMRPPALWGDINAQPRKRERHPHRHLAAASSTASAPRAYDADHLSSLEHAVDEQHAAADSLADFPAPEGLGNDDDVDNTDAYGFDHHAMGADPSHPLNHHFANMEAGQVDDYTDHQADYVANYPGY